MTKSDECLEKYREQLQKYKIQLKIKPNPCNYPIIDKWNYRTLRPHFKEIFDMMEQAIDEYVNLTFIEDDLINRGEK